MNPGTCRYCGCTETNACQTDKGPCFWVTSSQTICSNPSCVAKRVQGSYEYIHFTTLGIGTKTSSFECYNKSSGAVLGIVKWYGAWRQYCFFPRADIVFSAGCLSDVQDFIEVQMGVWRLLKKQQKEKEST